MVPLLYGNTGGKGDFRTWRGRGIAFLLEGQKQEIVIV